MSIPGDTFTRKTKVFVRHSRKGDMKPSPQQMIRTMSAVITIFSTRVGRESQEEKGALSLKIVEKRGPCCLNGSMCYQSSGLVGS